MISELSEAFLAAPALAIAGFAVFALYKVSMRALDALEQNTRALATLEASMKEDKRHA
jgi:hypothetical protein